MCRRWGANQVDCCSSWPSLPRRQADRWLDSEVASVDKIDNIDLTRDPSPPRKRTREEQEMLIVSKGKHIPWVRSPCANKKPLADRFANDPKSGTLQQIKEGRQSTLVFTRPTLGTSFNPDAPSKVRHFAASPCVCTRASEAISGTMPWRVMHAHDFETFRGSDDEELSREDILVRTSMLKSRRLIQIWVCRRSRPKKQQTATTPA